MRGWTKWTAFPGAAEFTAGDQPMTLRLPGHATAPYRGALRSVDKHTVNVLPLDRYVQGVVPREVPASWPADAVRAQAVAARTYAAYERAHATTYYDLCDTSSCQVYGGADAEDPASNAAVPDDPRPGRHLPGRSRRSPSSRRATAAGARPARSPTSSRSPTPTRRRRQPQRDLDGDADQPADREGVAPDRARSANISFTRDGNGDFGGRITTATFTGTLGSVHGVR